MQAHHAEFLPLAHKLADSAGEVLRRHFRTALPPEAKDDQSPVTRADREVEQVIAAIIRAQLPEHGIIGEEFGTVKPEATYQWVIDPIDGTRSFVAGYPLFTTLIALAYEGKPVLGIIDQPILRERWLSTGSETTLNGAPQRVRGCDSLGKAVIATTSANYFTPQQAVAYKHLSRSCAQGVAGGDAYAYAMLASGQLDIVVDAGTKPYDFCALAPIIASAGGIITDWEGLPLTTRSDGRILAACNAQLHASALSIIGGA